MTWAAHDAGEGRYLRINGSMGPQVVLGTSSAHSKGCKCDTDLGRRSSAHSVSLFSVAVLSLSFPPRYPDTFGLSFRPPPPHPGGDVACISYEKGSYNNNKNGIG